LGESEVFRSGAPLGNAALSPSGERLAIVVPTNKGLLQVWDRAGKKVMELKATEFPGGEWLAFLSDARLLVLGGGKLVAIDVPSGKAAYTVGAEVKSPIALSPGRKWVCAASLTDELKFFDAADGSAAGEIPKYARPTAVAFSPSGTALAVSFGGALVGSYGPVVIWDVAAGKPRWTTTIPNTTVYDRFTDSLGWSDERHLLVRGISFDLQRRLALAEYDYRNLTTAREAGPDGRLWAAGSYKQVLEAGVQRKTATPGPIVDAGVKGTKLLAAFTVPDEGVKQRLQAALDGIPVRAEEPIRIEVTGKGSKEAKQKLADAAAEEVAKRGKAVDPAATVGVRIELSGAERVRIGRPSTVPGAGPLIVTDDKNARDGYRIEASVRLINTANGSVSKTPGVLSRAADAAEPDWEAKILTGIGQMVGSQQIPLVAYFTSTGEGSGLGERLTPGIDGVVNLNRKN
jgi:hypothetical protein